MAFKRLSVKLSTLPTPHMAMKLPTVLSESVTTFNLTPRRPFPGNLEKALISRYRTITTAFKFQICMKKPVVREIASLECSLGPMSYV